MAKVVGAFSFDPEVLEAINKIAQQQSTWEKKPNKSRLVNQACRWYFMTDLAEEIEILESRAAYWQDKCRSNGGVKHHLVGLLKAIFRSGR
jgi:hypothetical protein